MMNSLTVTVTLYYWYVISQGPFERSEPDLRLTMPLLLDLLKLVLIVLSSQVIVTSY